MRSPSVPVSSGSVRIDLLGLAVGALDVATEQEVELLVGPAELDVGLDRHRVVPLQQRVEQLEHRDRLAGRVALVEVVALEDPGHRRCAHQREQALGIGMSSHSPLKRTSRRSGSSTFSAWSWKVFALASISRRIEHRPRGRASARVAHAGRVVTDDQDDGVPEILELAQLLQHDREAEMDVRRRRVDPQLDAQRPALAELALEASFGQAVDGVAGQPGGRLAGRRVGSGTSKLPGPRVIDSPALMTQSPSGPMLDSRRRLGSVARAVVAPALSKPEANVSGRDAPLASAAGSIDRMSDDDDNIQSSARTPPRQFRSGLRGGGGARPRRSARRSPRSRSCACSRSCSGLGVLAIVSTVFGMMMAVASDLPQLENSQQYRSEKNSYLYDDHWRPIGIFAPANHVVIDTSSRSPRR